MQSKWKIIAPLTRCRIVTATILMIGFSVAAGVYLNAGEEPLDPFAAYEDSKKFAHELERMGGKAAIVANDLHKWFVGLWQGEMLSYTVAVITVIIAAGYYFIASGSAGAERSGNDAFP